MPTNLPYRQGRPISTAGTLLEPRQKRHPALADLSPDLERFHVCRDRANVLRRQFAIRFRRTAPRYTKNPSE